MKLSAVVLAICAVLAGPASGQAASAVAPAQTAAVRTYQFDVPAGRLSDTLKTLARVTGKRVEYAGEAVAGTQVEAVKGELSLQAALRQVLSTTQLRAAESRDGAFWVAPPEQLDQVTILAKRDQAETSFKADRSDTATRSGTDLMELPGSVTILTSKVLETQQATSVQQALSNVSGVSFTESTQGKPSLSIRGYAMTTQAVNGISDAAASLTNVFGVERIEVLKGPQSILAGSDALGGTVNVVTKKPQAEAIRSLLLQYGTHDDITAAGDLAGALTDDKKLTYRLIASKSDAKTSEGGFKGREETYALPQLRWKDASTDFVIGMSYGKQFEPLRKYTVARLDGVIMPAPGLVMGNRDDGFDTNQKRYFYQLEQTITPSITLVSRLERNTSARDLHVYSPGGLNYTDGVPNGTISLYAALTTIDDTQLSGDHYLRIIGNTGPVQHKLSVGINHSRLKSTQTSWDGPILEDVPVYPVPGVVVFDPVSSNGLDPFMIFTNSGNQRGYFVQDLMTYGDWNLLLNMRRTKYTTDSTTSFFFGGPPETLVEPKQKTSSTTPGAGLIYSLSPSTSVYASYAEGFSPQFVPKCGGGLVDPMLTRNRELGAKFDLFDSRLSVTTAVFELSQSNTLRYDNTGSCATMMDAQVTKGFEFDLQGRLANRWNAVANYTYSTLKDKGDPARIFTAQPKHKVSLWTTYEFDTDALRGFGVGLGLTAQSKSNGEFRAEYAFTVPSQVQTDLSLTYKYGKWSSVLGVKNVFDRTLYGSANTSTFVPYLSGRTVLLTVKRDFN